MVSFGTCFIAQGLPRPHGARNIRAGINLAPIRYIPLKYTPQRAQVRRHVIVCNCIQGNPRLSVTSPLPAFPDWDTTMTKPSFTTADTAQRGEQPWFFSVNYCDTRIDQKAWFAFSRRGMGLKTAHSNEKGRTAWDAPFQYVLGLIPDQVPQIVATRRGAPTAAVNDDLLLGLLQRAPQNRRCSRSFAVQPQ